MAITPISIDVVPYQGQISITDNLTAAAANMSFINDGNTILVVTTGAVTPTLTITSTGTNPGVSTISGALVANKTSIYGPFQPLWWNFGGSVQVTLSSATSVTVACFKFLD